VTTLEKNFDVGVFPMGPNLRSWFGLNASQYKGTENSAPSADQVANFSQVFVQSMEDNTPKNPAHLVDILEELVGMNFPLLAIKFVDSYQHLFPHRDFRAQLHYGNASMLVGDLARAEAAFVAAQKIVPEEPAPYINLTQIYSHDDFHDKAREWCLAGLDVDPDNTRLWELAAWLEQIRSGEHASRETVAMNIAKLALDKNSWAGTSLACDLKNPEDVTSKAEALEVFWNNGVRDLAFLIEYTAVLGVAGRFDKIPTVVWQSKNGDQTPWQLLVHLAQAQLGLGRHEDALDALEMASKSSELTPEARSILNSLKAEIASENGNLRTLN
jgi:tetratricopeptide (TPR) repeat protein